MRPQGTAATCEATARTAASRNWEQLGCSTHGIWLELADDAGGAGGALGLGALDVDGGPFTGAVDHLAIAHCEHHVGTIAGIDHVVHRVGRAGTTTGP